MKYNVDIISSRRIVGWALHPSVTPLEVRAYLDDKLISSATTKHGRPDVKRANPDIAHSDRSGYCVWLDVPDGQHSVSLRAVVNGEEVHMRDVDVVKLTAEQISSARGTHYGQNDDAGAMLPLGVVSVVKALNPNLPDFENVDATAKAYFGALLNLARSGDLHLFPVLVSYVRYLKSCLSHFQMVDKYFPDRNLERAADAKDVNARQTLTPEIMSIAHQLYVLKGNGVTGSFAEFGCYKGFSTSKLSYACDLLDIPMIVFDSFEGLPASDSAFYVAGEFAGGLDEVTANVKMFGCASRVEFVKGFYSDSLKTYDMPDLMAIWMDVDLYSSAKDMMGAADKLHERSTLFSHECTQERYDGFKVVPGHVYADNVAAGICEHFDARGIHVQGRHVLANTGAFWRAKGGSPVVSNAVLMDFVSKI